MKRAKTVEQKENRRQDILNHCELLLDTKGVMDISMKEIADGLNLQKGTLYRYFESKEELFLSLLELAVIDLAENLKKRFDYFPNSSGNAELFTALFIECIQSERNRWKIISVLGPVLEYNVSGERIEKFKESVLIAFNTLSLTLVSAKLVKDKQSGLTLIKKTEVFLIGLLSLCDIPEKVKALYKKEPFESLQHDFGFELSQFLMREFQNISS